MLMLNCGIGLLTPPVGAVLFIGSAVAKRPMEKVVRATLPFYLCMIVALLLISFVPPDQPVAAHAHRCPLSRGSAPASQLRAFGAGLFLMFGVVQVSLRLSWCTRGTGGRPMVVPAK